MPVECEAFSERTVLEAKSKFVDTLVNVYSYVLYANLDEYNPNETYDVKAYEIRRMGIIKIA